MKCRRAEFDRLVIRGLSWWWRSLGLNWVWRFVREECTIHWRETLSDLRIEEGRRRRRRRKDIKLAPLG